MAGSHALDSAVCGLELQSPCPPHPGHETIIAVLEPNSYRPRKLELNRPCSQTILIVPDLSATWQDLEFVELFAGAGEVSSHLRKDCSGVC